MKGVARTSLAVACYLRYAEIFDDANSAFDYVVRRRTPDDSSWVAVGARRYIQYFNNVMMLRGSLPSPYPLRLHRVIMNGIPDFDDDNEEGSCDPGIEVRAWIISVLHD